MRTRPPMSPFRSFVAKHSVSVAYVIFVSIILLFLTAGIWLSSVAEMITVNTNRESVSFIVLEADTKLIRGSDHYLVSIQRVNGTDSSYSKGDIETVQVKDNWVLGNTRSADLYFALKNSAGSNQVWIGDIGGIRNGWLSWFPHIINAELTAFTVE